MSARLKDPIDIPQRVAVVRDMLEDVNADRRIEAFVRELLELRLVEDIRFENHDIRLAVEAVVQMPDTDGVIVEHDEALVMLQQVAKVAEAPTNLKHARAHVRPHDVINPLVILHRQRHRFQAAGVSGNHTFHVPTFPKQSSIITRKAPLFKDTIA